jgi:alanine racemase
VAGPYCPAMRARLTIDLDAVVANWRQLDRLVPCAAMVKADAYGLGAAECAAALAAAGCPTFFVAHLEEGVALRRVLPQAEILILHGAGPNEAAELIHHGLTPVLSTLAAVEDWALTGKPAAVHIDTGLNRLGLEPGETARLIAAPPRFPVRLWMSHLACADEPEHPLNGIQLSRFRAALAQLPPAPTSFSNSSGLFLGRDFLFDLGRPGAALYGVNPIPGKPNPMAEVVRLDVAITQLRRVEPGEWVGYGASYPIVRPSRIATVTVGYADGYHRGLSNRGFAVLAGYRVPVVGRVSMDLTTLDVTDVPEQLAQPGAWVTLIGGGVDSDELAAAAGTIAYDTFTGLGKRFERVYLSRSSMASSPRT